MCNGKFGKPSNSPLVWTRKGPWNLCVVAGIVPRGVTYESGHLVAIVSEHSM